MSDTIYALATSRGKAGVAVVRVSGPRAFDAVRRLAGDPPPPRQVSLRNLRSADGAVIDSGLVLCFEAGASFTGEDTAEFQVHGSIAGVNALLSELGRMPGLRLAEGGEFTRRALENDRLDLARVEGLADLIEAETEAQRRQAQRIFSGALSTKAESWRQRLVRAAALLEATIDFADEDVPVDVTPEVTALVAAVSGELGSEARGAQAAERIRDGFEVAIVGPPNAGKSTLLNALAGRDAAITSEYAGTTRDVIEVRMDLSGIPVTFLDTAGLRKTEDVVEGIGIQRALERAESADVRVFLDDGTGIFGGLKVNDHDIVLRAKADLEGGAGQGISGKTGHGVARLLDRLTAHLETQVSLAGDTPRERHRQAIGRAIAALDAARRTLTERPETPELAAEELRSAVRALDSLLGRVDVEDLLDEIFASFCLGK